MMQPLRHDETARRDALARKTPHLPDRTIRLPRHLGKKFHRVPAGRKSEQFHFITQFLQTVRFRAHQRWRSLLRFK